MNNINKIAGIVLLSVGLALILGSVFYSFQVFTGKVQAPEALKVEQKVSVQFQPGGSGSGDDADIRRALQEIVDQNIKGMIPAELVLNSFNLIAFSVFVTILIFAGTQIAGLGARLMRS